MSSDDGRTAARPAAGARISRALLPAAMTDPVPLLDAELAREVSGAPRAPHADLPELAHQAEGLQMALRLEAGTDEREHGGVRAGEPLGRHRGDRRRPFLGDEPPVYRHQGLARLGL